MANFNPFQPGAGRVPPVLAGRDEMLKNMETTIAQVQNTTLGARPQIYSGLRGVGKTVLLNQFVTMAKENNWLTVKIEASAGQTLSRQITRQLLAVLNSNLSKREKFTNSLRHALGVLKSFQLQIDPQGIYTFGLEIEPSRGTADSGELAQDLEQILQAVGEVAREMATGLILAIDELQDAGKPQLNALNLALHNLGQDARPLPIIFVGAGLPSLPAVLADATSYAERLYDYKIVGLLDTASTTRALKSPTENQHISWSDEAIQLAISSAKGYPYFVQASGKHIWEANGEAAVISKQSAEIGIGNARDEVDQGLYQSRWDRATPAQREMMKAMAADNDLPSAIADLVLRTNKKRTTDLSVSRRELIKGGHIFAPDRGYLAFTVPGMADFINRVKDVD